MCATNRSAERRRPSWRGELRVDDADRERAVGFLHAHAGAGRLDAEELDERAGRALRARTGDDLARLVADLPALPSDPAARRAAWAGEVRTYLVVIAVLVVVWLAAGAGHPWPVYPALGWGLPLLLSRPARAPVTRPHPA